MTFEVLNAAILRAKDGNEQPIRSLFSFLRDALARAEGQRDAYLAGWNKAAKQDRVKPPSAPKEPLKAKSQPQTSQKIVETEEDLGLWRGPTGGGEERCLSMERLEIRLR